ncbi:Uncharacterised protein [BD1-7 clade bacterium]|uniref:Uncharacterized protein n=1 Tax=BD1-7 clade bacterium TaxID=2029982 RepID=A0A5S9PUK4_9GAMM|nr:Uncharacterised protein [BD1-7 clade bacterium]
MMALMLVMILRLYPQLNRIIVIGWLAGRIGARQLEGTQRDSRLRLQIP